MPDKNLIYSGSSIASKLLQGTALGNWLSGGEFKSGKSTYIDGYGTEREDASLKESASGQELRRMKDTAKGALKLTATGLSFGNPITASSIMAPLITGSQAYWTATGLKDAKDIISDPTRRKVEDYATFALDTLPIIPVTKTLWNGTKSILQSSVKRAPSIIDTAFNNGTLKYGEPIVLNVEHASETPFTGLKRNFKRWDVKNHNADPDGAWFTVGESGGMMAERPFKTTGTITLNKPLIQTGEILGKTKNGTRNDIVRLARANGSDGVIFRNIADNKASNQDVVYLFGDNFGQFNQKYTSPGVFEASFVSESPFMNPGMEASIRKIRMDEKGLIRGIHDADTKFGKGFTAEALGDKNYTPIIKINGEERINPLNFEEDLNRRMLPQNFQDGEIVSRVLSTDELKTGSNLKDEFYSVFAPDARGGLDKYFQGNKGAKGHPGYDFGTYPIMDVISKRENAFSTAYTNFLKALESNNEVETARALRELEIIQNSRPSEIELYNLTHQPTKFTKESKELAQELASHIKDRLVDSAPFRVKEFINNNTLIPHRGISLKIGDNVRSPFVIDNTSTILNAPDINNVVYQYSKQLTGPYMKQLAEMNPDYAKYILDYASRISDERVIPDTLLKLIHGQNGKSFLHNINGFIVNTPDMTAGLGKRPDLLMSYDSNLLPSLVKTVGTDQVMPVGRSISKFTYKNGGILKRK